MPWTASGLYAQCLATNSLTGVAAATFGWNIATNKLALYNNTETPAYNQALASAIYSATNEVSGTGWAAGGVAISGLAAGPASMTPVFTYATPTPTVVQWGGNNVSVATTTLASPGAYGAYFYSATGTQYKYIGIYFGGAGYSTTAGTFAITWAGGIIVAITVASTS